MLMLTVMLMISRSQSVAKELMQTSPDLTAMYQTDQAAQARLIMEESIRRILFCLFLASYYRLKSASMVDGDLLPGYALAGCARDPCGRVQ